MKVAIILAPGRSAQDVLAPYRSAGFLTGLADSGVEPLLIRIDSHQEAPPATVAATDGSPSVRVLGCALAGLARLLAAERPAVIQTFGPEPAMAAIWATAATMGVPIIHGVSAWPNEAAAGPIRLRGSRVTTSRARRASHHVDAVIGSSHDAVGSLMAGGYFPRAAFSAIAAPPVAPGTVAPGAVAPGTVATAPQPRRTEPVFGIWDPEATAATLAFVAHAMTLTGRATAVPMRIALRRPDPGSAPSVTVVAANGIDAFLASIDILAVPVFDDAAVAPVIAALRQGKSVIVPDRGGAAEIVEYGRHGILFAAGSAYHFANALNLVSQSWSETPVLRREGGPAIAKTVPKAVATTFVQAYRRLAAVHQGPAVAPAGLRCGIVALARSDTRLLEATLQSIDRLHERPDAVALVIPAIREHLFAGVAVRPASAPAIRVVRSEGFDALPVSDAVRALASDADIVLLVPEGVVLGPDYLAAVRDGAGRWQDMVGELDLVEHTVDAAPADVGFRHDAPAFSLRRLLRARTLCASTLWVRVGACGNLKFPAFPPHAEYLAFSALLDQLRPRGRTRVTASGAAVQLRLGSERRSGFDAGREIYGVLSRIGELRHRSDYAFAQTESYLEPRTEKLRLFGEQMLRYVASPATRSHVGSFIRGMWTARREAMTSRHRIRDDIRRLG